MNKIKLFLLSASMFVGVNLQAQDKDSPWAIGLGLNMIDATKYGVSDIKDQFIDYIGPYQDTSTFPMLSRLYIARHLNKSFTIDFTFAYNQLKKGYGTADLPEKHDYFSTDLGLRYDLNNIIGETGWFDPYVKGGVGVVVVEGDYAIPFTSALGVNTWFNDSWGLNLETAYKASSVFGGKSFLGVEDAGYAGVIRNYHFQHSISLVYKFGKKDSDKDGVRDSEDVCPTIAGTPELLGCPDTDGDGIADKDDSCPNIAGTIATNGCPDSDGDGVIDSKDNCPNIAGTNKGCPDSDGDGVSDDKDMCPNLAGTIATSGCPDSDGDGVSDDKDKCPNEAGLASNDGCPVLDDKNKALIKSVEENPITFKFGKSIIKVGDNVALDDAVELMTAVKDIRLKVEGHADSTGSEKYNLKLSEQRANAVVKFLVSNGIDASRLEVVGYGEGKPVAPNNTSAGRAKNRRVQLTVLGK